MPAGWNLYDVYEWIPNVNSTQSYEVVNIGADGGAYEDNPPTEPWGGQFGTNQQWLSDEQSDQGGWVQLGPRPARSPPGESLPNGYEVWIDGNSGKGNPYLQIHYLGFESSPQSFDAFKVVEVPEPGTLATVGGWRRTRRCCWSAAGGGHSHRAGSAMYPLLTEAQVRRLRPNTRMTARRFADGRRMAVGDASHVASGPTIGEPWGQTVPAAIRQIPA